MSSDPTASPPPPPPADSSGATAPTTAPGPVDPNAIDFAYYMRFSVIAAIAGVALYLIAGMMNLNAAHDDHAKHAAKARFMSAYLSGYTFWLSLPIGGLALLMIHYLVKSSWGRLLRPLFEAASRTWPLFVILFIGLAAGTSSHEFSPYWWSEPNKAPTPEVNSANPAAGVEKKREQAEKYGEYMIEKAVFHEREAREKGNFGFLSTPAFFGVGAVLFGIWGTMIYLLNKWGRGINGSPAQVEAALTKCNYFAGPGLIVYAITITAAATQWVMSVEAGWASTMFPVIFAVNQFLTCFAFCLVLFLVIASRPPVKDVMRPKFQLDMATLLLAFTLFWTYTSFSQYMLVWVGNLPEEIPFYIKRSYSGWWYVSFGLAVLHFALPFLLLLFRDVKLHPTRLRTVAAFLLSVCVLDVVWWIAPASPPGAFALYWLMDVGAVGAIGGLASLYFFWELQKRPIFSKDDAFLLPEGHHHESH